MAMTKCVALIRNGTWVDVLSAPYHTDCTCSRLITEFKQCWVCHMKNVPPSKWSAGTAYNIKNGPAEGFKETVFSIINGPGGPIIMGNRFIHDRPA